MISKLLNYLIIPCLSPDFYVVHEDVPSERGGSEQTDRKARKSAKLFRSSKCESPSETEFSELLF
jgi:hypothetical protein